MAALLVRDVTALPMRRRGEVLEHVDLLIEGSRLSAIGPTGALPVPSGARVLDGRGRLALPGLVNAHGHAGLALLKAASEALPLGPWLEWLSGRQRAMSRDDLYWSTLLACLEQIRAGITTFADMLYLQEACAPAVEQSGLRAVLSESVMEDDPWDGSAAEGLARLERSLEFALRWQGRGAGRLTTRLAPHSVYTVRPSLLRAFAETAGRHRLALQIHCSETRAEVEACRARFGCTPPGLLAATGCLDQPILLAHAVHLADEDLALLDRPNVAISHNPGSNLKLQSGIARLPELVGRRLAIGLGTDSAASNDTLDILKEAYLAAVLHPWPLGSQPAWAVLEMATLGGARALGLADEIGSLEPGKRADLILIDRSDPRHVPGLDPAGHLVYTGRAGDVVTTIVDGQVLMEERVVPHLDVAAIERECRARARRVLAS